MIYNFEPDQTIADVRRLLTTHAFLHGFCLPISSTDQAIVNLLHDHRKCVGVYTCNSDAEINQALQLGVDILISDTNDPKISARIPEWFRKAVAAETFVVFPLCIKGNAVAMIYADRALAGEIVISEKELSLLRTLRNQAVLAIKQSV